MLSLILPVQESRMNPSDDPQKPTPPNRIGEEMYRAFVEQASEAIVVLNDDLTIVDVNEMASHLTGYSRDELIGRSSLTLVNPLDFAVRPPEPRRFDAGDTILSQRRMVRKDGTTFESESSARRVAPGLIISIMRDITAARRAESLLRQSNEELERRVAERTSELADAYRELESFSYSVAHDLRSPLRAMDGFSSILLLEHSHELSDEATSHLHRISANARRMGLLIDALLGYARMGRSPIRSSKLDIIKLVREEYADLTQNLEGREVELIVGEIPAVDGDLTLIKLLLNNLLDNALKFSKPGQKTTIEVGYEPSKNAVFIKDNGIGFDQRYAGRLFRVFERLHDGEFDGTGVGLATVKRIVDRHGGSVWAEGTVDQGATFWFSLTHGQPTLPQ